MASANAFETEARPHWYFWPWLHVSLPSLSISTLAPFNCSLSICVVTILRIVTAAQFDIDDFTYGFAKLAIWTDLEPTLGMVNACLPVIQPALIRVLGSRRHECKTSFISSSVARLRSKSNNGSKNRKFNDSYLLTETGTTESYVGSNSKPSSTMEDMEAQEVHSSMEPRSEIKVKKDWQVVSEF